jgi:hypothetical protein
LRFWLALTKKIVNDLSNSIDLESTLIRAEALFRRFQRTVEAIDKKSNFPAPKLRQRQPIRNTSSSSADSNQSATPADPVTSSSPAVTKANTSGTDTVTANATNSGATGSGSTGAAAAKNVGRGNGKKKDEDERAGQAQEAPKPKVISPELRELLSTKVEVLPRRIVRKEGEGRSSLGK